MTTKFLSSSFRDPCGVVFSQDGLFYRQINNVYKENFEHLMNSGLYKKLTDENLLIKHEEVYLEQITNTSVYKIIKPELINFISYPYEWSFSQLKDAALLTLKIQKIALDFEMSLKDCSAYNFQFKSGKPVFIDTLSFEKYTVNKPWNPYKQFCQHFLAPLMLMSYTDIRLNELFKCHIDGIPLDLASKLLPFWTYFIPPILIHIHLHAKTQKYYENRNFKNESSNFTFTKYNHLALVDSLESAVKKIKLKLKNTVWSKYYEYTNYTKDGLNHKKEIVKNFISLIKPKTIMDLGANDGTFSRLAAEESIQVISFDLDPLCVEKNYIQAKKDSEKNILPLVVDLTNPSPAIGFANNERMSFSHRFSSDLVMALALIHHLAIANNLPFEKIANFISNFCNSLIIEFVPKEDSQVQRLLTCREDIFLDYTKEYFELEFSKYFKVEDSIQIKDSKRTLYCMQKRKVN